MRCGRSFTKSGQVTSMRKRVDWDAEIQKTEQIKRKGLLMSVISFAFAVAFIFGISRSTGADIEIPRAVLLTVAFVVSFVVFRAVVKHRKNHKHD